MRMPKTAMHHYYCPVFWQHDIGATRKVFGMEAEPAAARVESAADHDFWPRVLGPEASHQGSALFWINNRHSAQLG